MEKKKGGSSPPPQSPKLRLKQVEPRNFPRDFVGGVAAEGGQFAFKVGDGFVDMEVQGLTCTLLLNEAATRALLQQVRQRAESDRFLEMEGYEKGKDLRTELPLRDVVIYDTGACRVVLATWAQVRYALRHPRP